MLRKLADKLLVPCLTIAILVLVIWGVLRLTQAIGENLEPVKPRVLVFGASWCHACPSERALQQLQEDFPNVEVVHYDADMDTEQFEKYHIRTLPTLIVCGEKGCKVFNSLVALRAWLTNGEIE